MRDNYWERARARRYSRRTVLGGAVAGSVGLVVGAACSGDDDKSDNLDNAPTASAAKQEEVKSWLWQGVDTTGQAKKGGILNWFYSGDITNLDPLSATSYSVNYQTNFMYPALLQFKMGHLKPATNELTANLAESWQQPDPLTIIFKLQPKARWDDKLNGRAIDADDVVFSWKKYAAKGQTRIDLANSASPDAPIVSVEAVDKSTVKFNLAFPMAATLGQLAYTRNLLVMPRESEGPSVPNGYNPLTETRSGGPWILDSYQRSVAFKYRRNPNWWDADKVWMDGIDMPIITETAVYLAQLRAGKLDYFPPPAKDLIQLHKDIPELRVVAGGFTKSCYQLDFGMRPNSPFRDPRVRQAASMLIDRDAFLDNWNNVSDFKKEGYPMETAYNSNLSAGWGAPYWVDPKSPDMGEGAKSFTFNVAEAKKLLSAAGYTGPISTEIAWIPEGYYGTDFPKWAETFKGFFEADGLFKLKQVNPPYATEYLPKYYWNKADFEGIAVAATTDYPADPDGHIFSYYHSRGSREKVAFQGKETIDTKSDKMIEDQRRELDSKKRIELIREWQRYAATQMPIIPFPGKATPFGMAWASLASYNEWRDWDWESQHNEQAVHHWLDVSKRPG